MSSPDIDSSRRTVIMAGGAMTLGRAVPDLSIIADGIEGIERWWAKRISDVILTESRTTEVVSGCQTTETAKVVFGSSGFRVPFSVIGPTTCSQDYTKDGKVDSRDLPGFNKEFKTLNRRLPNAQEITDFTTQYDGKTCTDILIDQLLNGKFIRSIPLNWILGQDSVDELTDDSNCSWGSFSQDEMKVEMGGEVLRHFFPNEAAVISLGTNVTVSTSPQESMVRLTAGCLTAILALNAARGLALNQFQHSDRTHLPTSRQGRNIIRDIRTQLTNPNGKGMGDRKVWCAAITMAGKVIRNVYVLTSKVPKNGFVPMIAWTYLDEKTGGWSWGGAFKKTSEIWRKDGGLTRVQEYVPLLRDGWEYFMATACVTGAPPPALP